MQIELNQYYTMIWVVCLKRHAWLCAVEDSGAVGVVPHYEASVSADDALFHHGDTLAHRNSGGGNELILRGGLVLA
jgi:hypothetical protein